MNALLTWLKAHPTGRRRLLVACGGVLLFSAGVGVGSRLHPRTVTVREAEQTLNESAGLDLRRVETKEQKPSVVTRKRTLYREGPVREEVVTRVEQGGSTVTTDTHEQVHDDLRLKTAERSTVVVSPEGRWSIRLLAGADTGGSVVAGASVEYRVVGPLTLGAWATAPVAGAPGRFTVGISAGLRL